MESMENKANDGDVVKRKKPNIFRRVGNRISKYFTKSIFPPSSENREDIAVTISVSHDDLSNMNETRNKNTKNNNKRMKICDNLNIPKRNDRCLSEGDLTRDEDQFYSQEPSPKNGTPQTYISHNSRSPETGDIFKDSFRHKNGHSFKNELALKLRAKNPPKDNESEHSKTPDSPTGLHGTEVSPVRQLFTEPRTPRSMSSLSHSSNSLLSATANNSHCVTSDGESMSRSMVDSNDDMGIVVDLVTPLSKITTGSLLDSTAARQKIAASKARRVRPKALGNISADKPFQRDSKQLSPIRDNKVDLLEEISEEDVTLSPLHSEQHTATSPVAMDTAPLQSLANVPVSQPDNIATLSISSPKVVDNVQLRSVSSSTVHSRHSRPHNSLCQDDHDGPSVSKSDRPLSDPFTFTKTGDISSSPPPPPPPPTTPLIITAVDTNNTSQTERNTTVGFDERRSFKILSLMKNFEGVH